jgi:hypothetical protein
VRDSAAILDATNPDLSAFYKRGGKMLVTIGSNDTLASPGAQLDYFQSVLDKMGRSTVDRFARLWVMPQTGHGLSGSSYNVAGDGKATASAPIPSTRACCSLGRATSRQNVCHGDSGGDESAAVFVSDVSPVKGGTLHGEFVQVRSCGDGLNR